MPRDFLFLNCQDGNHDWKFRGGANAGCGPDCACSVPVHECAMCGDCDYGKNDEADTIRRECKLIDGETECVTPQDNTPPELKAVLAAALAGR